MNEPVHVSRVVYDYFKIKMLSIKMQQKEDVGVQMLYMQQNFSNLLAAKEYDKNLEFLNN